MASNRFPDERQTMTQCEISFNILLLFYHRNNITFVFIVSDGVKCYDVCTPAVSLSEQRAAMTKKKKKRPPVMILQNERLLRRYHLLRPDFSV